MTIDSGLDLVDARLAIDGRLDSMRSFSMFGKGYSSFVSLLVQKR